MPDLYEVVSRNENDFPKCDRCDFEDAELLTIEGTGTVELASGATDIERLCRYCYATELGGFTPTLRPSTRVEPDTRLLARGIVHAFNAMELALRFEIQQSIVAMGRAIAEEYVTGTLEQGGPRSGDFVRYVKGPNGEDGKEFVPTDERKGPKTRRVRDFIFGNRQHRRNPDIRDRRKYDNKMG